MCGAALEVCGAALGVRGDPCSVRGGPRSLRCGHWSLEWRGRFLPFPANTQSTTHRSVCHWCELGEQVGELHVRKYVPMFVHFSVPTFGCISLVPISYPIPQFRFSFHLCFDCIALFSKARPINMVQNVLY